MNEIIATIEVYIHLRTEQNIRINFRPQDLHLIMRAHSIATEWLNNNVTEMRLI